MKTEVSVSPYGNGSSMASSPGTSLGSRCVAAWVAVAVALFLLFLGAAFVWLHQTSPSDGAWLEPGHISAWKRAGVELTVFDDVRGGLQSGDVVIAVEGQSMESLARSLFTLNGRHPAWRLGQTVEYTIVRDGQQMNLVLVPREYPLAAFAVRHWSLMLFALVLQLVAAFVFFRRPRYPAARALLLAGSAVLSAMTWSLGLQVSDLVGGIGFWLFKATTFGAYMLFWVAMLHFALTFPRPQPLVQKRPWIVPSIYAAPWALYPAYLAAAWPGASSTLDWLGKWIPGESALAATYLSAIVLAFVASYRASRDRVTRQQIRWVVYADYLVGGGGVFLYLLPDIVLGHKITDGSTVGLLGLPLPLAVAVAILRYHLFDIDVIINRTMVYGSLTATIIGIYVLVMGYVGVLFHPGGEFHTVGDVVLSLLAAGIVAVIFQPLRSHLQRFVNRLMYGERDEPYAVLSRLGQRLEATLAPEAVPQAIVETVAQALKLPYAAIALKHEDSFNVAASYGQPGASEALDLPLVYQGETIGRLILAARSPGEPFAAGDRRLLDDLARQVGIAAHALQLNIDLQRSRERLIIAREEERRRIRRDLHDGLGPSLASLTLKLDAARNLLTCDPPAADALLSSIKSETQSAISEIRRLVYELRPPALDELGLVSAIREHAAQYAAANRHDRGSGGDPGRPAQGSVDRYPSAAQDHRGPGLRVSVDAPETLPTLPAAVEVAAYRIVMESLTNVVRHARASTCVVRLSLEEDAGLQVEIIDDGVGLRENGRTGVGLASMRERAAELGGTCVIESRVGGGTRILVDLPVANIQPALIGRHSFA